MFNTFGHHVQISTQNTDVLWYPLSVVISVIYIKTFLIEQDGEIDIPRCIGLWKCADTPPETNIPRLRDVCLSFLGRPILKGRGMLVLGRVLGCPRKLVRGS